MGFGGDKLASLVNMKIRRCWLLPIQHRFTRRTVLQSSNLALVPKLSVLTSTRRYKSTIAATNTLTIKSTTSTVTPLHQDDSTLSSSSLSSSPSIHEIHDKKEIHRLQQIRNVGIFAHVDAGKTTVTERMLALAGVVREAGSVDDGNTVTDYLPAERERGITISSAAISFPWGWHNNRTTDSVATNNHVTVHLIDTPGHVDFSVEVNRSVAVLDGAVLVVDSVAGVQAQTETVWRAMTRPFLNSQQLTGEWEQHAHEPLPCLALINKMDKEGCHFGNAIRSLKQKLPGANPIPIQIPLFRSTKNQKSGLLPSLEAGRVDDSSFPVGDFVGVIDLIHLRAIIWPDNANVADVEACIPNIIALIDPKTGKPKDLDCEVTQEAISARNELLEALAECDETIEGYYLTESEPKNAELRAALRRATLSQRCIPVMASAALRGKGVEPVLDAIADLLPSPLDRQSPVLTCTDDPHSEVTKKNGIDIPDQVIPVGHPLNKSLLALAFKVVHMKGRGGSGDGRVVFARVYSGQLKERDVIQVLTPPRPGEAPEKPRKERIGGMLELAGGRFGNLEDGICKSGDVCALVGLAGVVTGDTITMMPDRRDKKKHSKKLHWLTGVTSPKPVLKVRLETETTEHQKILSNALRLLSIEDPSLVVEETEADTLLSGLGELHIEVTLDRILREFDLRVTSGPPSVAYRETVTDRIRSEGLLNYDRTIAGTRLQAAVGLILTPTGKSACTDSDSVCMTLTEPVVTVANQVKEFLNLDLEDSDEELMIRSELFKSLVQGCQGALKRGPRGPYAMANVNCHVTGVDGEEGLSGLQALPGALRAASAHAVTALLSDNKDFTSVLEPTMRVEISLPNVMVGSVLSDLTGSRRGTIDEVVVGENAGGTTSKALLRGQVPLGEILGYARTLRSLTGGEGCFTAEYKGHSPSS